MAILPPMTRATAVLFLLAAAEPVSAPAQSVESFYEGKTVTMVIGGPPAGAYDVYARLAGRYLGKYSAGNPPIVARNMPGAGGLVAANYMFNVAPRDGSELAILQRNLAIEPLFSKQPYDGTRFSRPDDRLRPLP